MIGRRTLSPAHDEIGLDRGVRERLRFISFDVFESRRRGGRTAKGRDWERQSMSTAELF